jgi:NhaP-type Na+/H+ or K+/H+ antiporter
MYENLAILGIFIFLYSITSKGFERTPINGAIVFAAFGLLLGPLGLDLLKLDVTERGLSTLAELTLALLLFTEAANANLGILKKSFQIPQRLLLISLPLTILLGFGLGFVFFQDLTLLEIAIIATLLAPTDAALGKAVVTDESVPINIREGLKVESGLNDGICVPILLLFLALASSANEEGSTTMLALKLIAEEVGIGCLVGVVLTIMGTWLIKLFAKREWITETWRQMTLASLGVACYAAAQSIGGSGFIASFVGGMLFGWIVKDEHKHKLLIAAEGTGDTLALITWVAFGVGVVGHRISMFDWKIAVYALLSLTVIRMLPAFLSLTGTKLRTDEKLFIGWFGPRGLASIVFAVIVINKHLPGGETIRLAAIYTIILSVIAHGLSASPLVARLAAKASSSPGEPTVK